MSRLLTFQYPIFHQGLNSTCRRRSSWASLKPGDEIRISRSLAGEAIGQAEVWAIYNGPFTLLPKELVALEHYPSAQDKTELLRQMAEIYPGFSEGEIVTMIVFEPSWDIEEELNDQEKG